MGKKTKKGKVPQKGEKGTATGRPTMRQRQSSKPGITMDQYEALLASWVNNRSARKAAKDAGVSRSTATKYINEGMPEFGMPPIKDQAKQVDEKAQEMKKLTLAEFRADNLALILEARDTSKVQLRLHRVVAQQKAREAARQEFQVKLDTDGQPMKDPVTKQPIYELDAHGHKIPIRVFPSQDMLSEVRTQQTLQQMGERALGAADETVGSAEREHVLATMTTDEKREYVMTGKLPFRLRK